MELPNIPGDSDGFDAIEPALRSVSQEVQVGACRVRRVAVRDVLGVATRMILANPAALLRSQADPDSQSAAALRQRVARVSEQTSQSGS
jgi:aminoglycoside 3-N-acetyltransferase